MRGNSYSDLPPWTQEVLAALNVSAAQSGVTLNVVQTPRVTVTGTVLHNGAPPMRSCSTASPATIYFDSLNDNYDTTALATCDNAFSWSVNLFPSTYKVSVRGNSFTDLPQWEQVIVERIVLPTP